MKANVTVKVLVIMFLAAFGLSIMASAQARKHCSNAQSAGEWGFTTTGALILPTGSVPLVAVGAFTQDLAGNLNGTQTRSVGGLVAHESFKGNVTTKPDCTATDIINVFDDAGALVRTTTLEGVIDDNGNEGRAIFKSLVLPDGTSLPIVISIETKRLFSKH